MKLVILHGLLHSVHGQSSPRLVAMGAATIAIKKGVIVPVPASASCGNADARQARRGQLHGILRKYLRGAPEFSPAVRADLIGWGAGRVRRWTPPAVPPPLPPRRLLRAGRPDPTSGGAGEVHPASLGALP